MRADLLHVVTVVANPVRWKSRLALFKRFAEGMVQAGVQLHVVECAYGDIPHEIGNLVGINHIPVRAKTWVWQKENLLNLAIGRLPQDWKYVAWIDADIVFRQTGWAAEIVYALQHFDIIQPWETCFDMGPSDEHLQTHTSFGSLFVKKPWCIGKMVGYTFAHPGYAWAATRAALEKLGGLIETAALGAADHHMALSLAGKAHLSFPGGISQEYKDPILRWQDRAVQHINHNVGFMPWVIEHMWHGSKDARRYVGRWEILTKHKFNPETDLKKNVWGVVELAGNKPHLTRDIWRYMRERNEDATTL